MHSLSKYHISLTVQRFSLHYRQSTDKCVLHLPFLIARLHQWNARYGIAQLDRGHQFRRKLTMNKLAHAKGQQKIRNNSIWLANIGTGEFSLMHLLRHTPTTITNPRYVLQIQTVIYRTLCSLHPIYSRVFLNDRRWAQKP